MRRITNAGRVSTKSWELHTIRKISRTELARSVDVSVRLVTEFEQGKRPDVSFETALRLLRAGGVSVIARAPGGKTVEIHNSEVAAAERAQRAAVRRATWSGGFYLMHPTDDPAKPEWGAEARLASVADVSRRKHAGR